MHKKLWKKFLISLTSASELIPLKLTLLRKEYLSSEFNVLTKV